MYNRLLAALIAVSALILLSSSVSAELQNLCLTENQTIPYSQCNTAYDDYTCESSSCVNICVNYISGIYCPANPGLCSAASLECTYLNQTNSTNPPGNNTNTTNPVFPIVSRPPIDIGYILKNPSSPNTVLTAAMNESGYSYELIDDNALAAANFSRYNILLVWDENILNYNLVPITSKKSLVANTYYVLDWAVARNVGSQSGSQPAKGKIIAHNNITLGVPETPKLYTAPGIELNYLPKLPNRAAGIQNIIGTNDADRDIVIGIMEEGGALYPSSKGNATAKTVFFGITKTQYWTANTTMLFKNSLDWLYNGDNLPPVILPISPLAIEETQQAVITVLAEDPNNDTLTYSINDARFIKSGNKFIWNTTYNDEGNYTFTITVSDGKLSASTFAEVHVAHKARPISSINIPNIVWNEDANKTLNLSQYFINYEGDSMEFGVYNTSSNQAISVVDLGNSIMLFSSQANWSGNDWIQFSASDSQSTAVSNIVNLSVLPVNDAPVLEHQLPANITWRMDDENPNAINLNNYFSDIDSNLTFSASGNQKISISFSNGFASFIPLADWFGNETIVFRASDSQSTADSNPVILEVKWAGKRPVFDNLTCQAEIEEDSSHSCAVTATDAENDTITFSVGSADNLNCAFNGSQLTYSPANNFNGQASCILVAADDDGFRTKSFNVNVLPVNDMPSIISKTPDASLINLIEGRSQALSIRASDIDSQSLNISWFVNNVLNSTESGGSSLSSSFSLLSPNLGSTQVAALISDGSLTINHTWNVVVGPISDFTCSEVGGNICADNLACSENPFTTKDTNSCCASSCIPSFKNAGACTVKNNSMIGIEITDPDSDEEFDIGKEIFIEADIENKFSEDQRFKVKSVLYNLDKNRAEDEDEVSLSVGSGDSRTAIMNIIIPDDAQEGSYALFVKASDDFCNQDYIDLDINRPDNKLIVSSLAVPARASCGDTIKIKAKVENIGSDSQDVQLSLSGASFARVPASIFEIDAFDDSDDVIQKEFTIEIPEDIKEGTYSIKATAEYNSLTAASEAKEIQIDCPQESEARSETEAGQIDMAEALQLNSVQNSNAEAPSQLSILVPLLIFTAVWLIVGLAVYLIIASRKK